MVVLVSCHLDVTLISPGFGPGVLDEVVVLAILNFEADGCFFLSAHTSVP